MLSPDQKLGYTLYRGHNLESISDALYQKQHSLTIRKLSGSDFLISNQSALLLLRNY